MRQRLRPAASCSRHIPNSPAFALLSSKLPETGFKARRQLYLSPLLALSLLNLHAATRALADLIKSGSSGRRAGERTGAERPVIGGGRPARGRARAARAAAGAAPPAATQFPSLPSSLPYRPVRCLNATRRPRRTLVAQQPRHHEVWQAAGGRGQWHPVAAFLHRLQGPQACHPGRRGRRRSVAGRQRQAPRGDGGSLSCCCCCCCCCTCC